MVQRETRRNLFLNPAVVDTTRFEGASGQSTLSYVGTSVRWTFIASTAIGIVFNTATPSGAQRRLLVHARAVAPISAALRICGLAAGESVVGTDLAWFEMTATAPANESTGARTGFLIPAASAPVVNDFFEVDRVLLAVAGDVGPYFDGSSLTRSADGGLYRYFWAGAVNASESYETFESFSDIYAGWSTTDLEYAALRKLTGLSLQSSLADLRKAAFPAGEYAYWSVYSGLSSAASLTDHKYAAMKVILGVGGVPAVGTITDVQRQFSAYILNQA